MYVVTVIPIGRTPGKEELSYFSPKNIPRGSLVEAPIRNRKTVCLVVNCLSARGARASLRSGAFALRKVSRVICSSFYSPAFIAAAEETARYHLGRTGEVIYKCTPSFVLLMLQDNTWLKELDRSNPCKIAVASKCDYLPTALQAESGERYAMYRNLIREMLAKNLSTLVVVPTIHDSKIVSGYLSRGIEEYVENVAGITKKGAREESWKRAATEAHAMVIVMTPSCLSIPRTDIGAIIVDRESDASYKHLQRPYINLVRMVINYARALNVQCFLGDTTLSVMTHAQIESGAFVRAPQFRNRLTTPTKNPMLIDMNSLPKSSSAQKRSSFSVLSREALGLCEMVQNDGGHLFLMVARHGYASTVVCSDCGTHVACALCKRDMLVRESKTADTPPCTKQSSSRHLFCPHCAKSADADILCTLCGSWRLVPLGIEIERVEETVGQFFPKLALHSFSALRYPKELDRENALERFWDDRSAVLVATRTALQYAVRPFDHSAVVSLDTYFSLPDFRRNERLFSLLTDLRIATRSHLLIQTRHPKESIWGYLNDDRLFPFYRDELEERRRYSYPPQSVFIKVTWSGPQKSAGGVTQTFKKSFLEWKPVAFLFGSNKGGMTVVHILKIAREAWEKSAATEHKDGHAAESDDDHVRNLRALLLALPPAFIIDVEPRELTPTAS